MRKARNRYTAAKSREKQKREVAELEQKVYYDRLENAQWKAYYTRIRDQLQRILREMGNAESTPQNILFTMKMTKELEQVEALMAESPWTFRDPATQLIPIQKPEGDGDGDGDGDGKEDAESER